jgi:hypothetical protein
MHLVHAFGNNIMRVMMSPPSRGRSLSRCSTASGRNFLATFGWIQNRVAQPYARTLRTASSRRPTLEAEVRIVGLQ